MEHVVILGSGPSGIAAAIYLAKSGYSPLVIEDKQSDRLSLRADKMESSQAGGGRDPGNGMSDPMRMQAIRLGVRFRAGRASRLQDAPFQFELAPGLAVTSRAVIITDGNLAHPMDILGGHSSEELGESAIAGYDGFFVQGHQLFVGGGGHADGEDALFLTRFASEARLVQRRMKLRAALLTPEGSRANPSTRWMMDVTPIEVIPGELGLHGLKVRMRASSPQPPTAVHAAALPHGRELRPSSSADYRLPAERSPMQAAQGSPAARNSGLFACPDIRESRGANPIHAAAAGCLAAIRCEHYLTLKAAAV